MLKIVCASTLFAGAEAVLALHATGNGLSMWYPSGACVASFHDNSNTIEKFEKVTCVDAGNVEIKGYSASDSACAGTPTSTRSMNLAAQQSQHGGPPQSCEESCDITGHITSSMYSSSDCGSSSLCGQHVSVIGVCIKADAYTSTSGQPARSHKWGNTSMQMYGTDDCTGAVLQNSELPLDVCPASANECHDGSTSAYQKDTVELYSNLTVELCSNPTSASGSATLAPSLLASAVFPCVLMGSLA